MNRIWLLTVIMACPLLMLAQSVSSQDSSSGSLPFQPAVPSGSEVYGGGWGGYDSTAPGTAAGSAMQGMASVVSAAGNYNLSTSAAAVNMSQARKQEIENYDSYVDTYFQTRQLNKAARVAERGPPPSAAQLNRIAQAGLPKPLAPQQLDPVSGTIAWPTLLQTAPFASECAVLNKAFAWRAQYGSFDVPQLVKVQEATNTILSQLKSMVGQVGSTDYMQAKNFIESLAFAARQPVV